MAMVVKSVDAQGCQNSYEQANSGTGPEQAWGVSNCICPGNRIKEIGITCGFPLWRKLLLKGKESAFGEDGG